MIPGLLDLIVPGSGHFVIGRRRVGLLFLVPPLLLLVVLVVEVVSSGPIGLLEVAVTPGVLPALAVLNVLLALWRIAAGIDTARRRAWTRRSAAVIGVAIVTLVVVPHVVVGVYIASANDFLDSTFTDVADVPEETDPPDEQPHPTRPTSQTRPTSPASSRPTRATRARAAGATSPQARPPRRAHRSRRPRPARPWAAGPARSRSLGASVPWTRPGAVPWGDDGRFDLLLLGSDAGIDRWSRRMDVMLLVEVDVATGKVAMIGLPRNLRERAAPAGGRAQRQRRAAATRAS